MIRHENRNVSFLSTRENKSKINFFSGTWVERASPLLFIDGNSDQATRNDFSSLIVDEVASSSPRSRKLDACARRIEREWNRNYDLFTTLSKSTQITDTQESVIGDPY